MRNKNGFEMSISMLIVIILGIVILGVGFAIFAQAQTKIGSAQEEVSAQAQQQLEMLLIDSSSPVVLPFSTAEISRGKSAIFNLGMTNILGNSQTFKLSIEHVSTTSIDSYTFNTDEWFLIFPSYMTGFVLNNNQQEYIPLMTTVPKDAPKGQHGFLVKITYEENGVENLYGSAQMIYVIV
jgi:hypothetical protein